MVKKKKKHNVVPPSPEEEKGKMKSKQSQSILYMLHTTAWC